MEKAKSNRRTFLGKLGMGTGALVVAPWAGMARQIKQMMGISMENKDSIINIRPMGFMWETADPFLFCVHHEDQFPRGNAAMGPATSLSGRSLGDDFIIKDGFRMYHGKTIPGFPGHPHRGFETITVVRRGLVDHADSMGAAGRYGNGDVQWMTAGKGVQHSEMFPLLKTDADNPLELFQIWLNLPASRKMVEPHFKMFWSEKIPHITEHDKQGKESLIEVIAGNYKKQKALQPPPDSWAADATHEVAVWNIRMEPGAELELPAASKGINRNLYFYEGDLLKVNGTELQRYQQAQVNPEHSLNLKAGNSPTHILILQGRPIGEHVIQYGPFVMNTKEEINQAFEDYHRTQFGGWPWGRYDQVHPREKGRFARHASGKEEFPGA